MELALVRGFALPAFNRSNIRKRWFTDLRASIATLVLTAICLAGCNTQSTTQIVAEIGAQIPLVQAVITTASAMAQGIDPSAVLLITTATDSAQLGLAQLKTLCDSYAQSPDATVLASISAALNALLNDNATSLLNAAHIVDPASRNIAQVALGALQTALLLVSAILQKSQTASQVAATAAARTYKLRDIAPYLDRQQIQQATGVLFNTAIRYEESQGF